MFLLRPVADRADRADRGRLDLGCAARLQAESMQINFEKSKKKQIEKGLDFFVNLSRKVRSQKVEKYTF